MKSLRSLLSLFVVSGAFAVHADTPDEIPRPDFWTTNGLVRTVSGRAPAPATIDDKSQMKARGGKQQVVRQHPKPFVDVQGCKKCGESGGQVEVGQRIVQQLR